MKVTIFFKTLFLRLVIYITNVPSILLLKTLIYSIFVDESGSSPSYEDRQNTYSASLKLASLDSLTESPRGGIGSHPSPMSPPPSSISDCSLPPVSTNASLLAANPALSLLTASLPGKINSQIFIFSIRS